MTINYYLLTMGDLIVGPGSQPATQTQTQVATDPTTGEPTTTTIDVPLPLPPGCIPCTQAQAETWQSLELVNGVLQPIPTISLVATAQAIQAAQLTTDCKNAITGGFVSSALGSPYTYPSTLIDQHNLASSVIASLLPNLPSGWTTVLWCMNSAGVWNLTPHTAAQIQQVGLDGKAWVTAQQITLANLLGQVGAATTVANVPAVTW